MDTKKSRIDLLLIEFMAELADLQDDLNGKNHGYSADDIRDALGEALFTLNRAVEIAEEIDEKADDLEFEADMKRWDEEEKAEKLSYMG